MEAELDLPFRSWPNAAICGRSSPLAGIIAKTGFEPTFWAFSGEASRPLA